MPPLTPPDFGSQRFKANPFPYYAHLREEAPVLRIEGPAKEPAWLVTRYDEGQIAIQTLVNRFPNLRLSKPAESLKWRTGFLLRGPTRLPVSLRS